MASLVLRLSPGSTFAERFRILAYVGQGSMGSVYRAEPLSGGELVALKLVKLDAGPLGDGRALRRFEREVESGQRIDSPYVARTLQAGKLGDGLAWLTMEYARGTGLDELLKARGALTLEQARLVLSQVFGAVAAAHAQGIVHRDLKPENIKVAASDEAFSVKVLDFGIAKDFGPSALSGTTPGLGTPLWTAPEQGREGYLPLPSTDVWALGLLTFFALTGALYWRHASTEASIADLAIELVRSELVPASQRARELGLEVKLPVGFDAWFAKTVARDPALRFASAAEAWEELEPLLLAPSEPRPSSVAPLPARLTVAPGWFLTAVIMGCVAMALAIFWLLRSMRI